MDLLKKNNCDYIFISDLTTIRYLCGFTGSNAILFYGEHDCLFVTDGRYEIQAHNEVHNAEVFISGNKGRLWLDPDLKISKKCPGKIGVFSKVTSVELYNELKSIFDLELIDTDPAEIRIIKSDDEVRILKESIRIQEESFKQVLSFLGQFPTEKEFAAKLEYFMSMNGSEQTAFPTIVAFKENSAIPHHSPTNKVISGKGFLKIDFGAKYSGYSSDQTVTFILGKPQKQMDDIYDTVYTAQQKAIEAVKPGIKAYELNTLAYDHISSKGYKKYIQHGLGHGIGLCTHELPLINSSSDVVLQPGMVFSIEPGIYIPDMGGVRLEDLILVTSDGFEKLTGLPKEKKVLIL